MHTQLLSVAFCLKFIFFSLVLLSFFFWMIIYFGSQIQQDPNEPEADPETLVIDENGNLISAKMYVDFSRLRKIIKDCINSEHVTCALNLLEHFEIKYGQNSHYHELKSDYIIKQFEVCDIKI